MKKRTKHAILENALAADNKTEIASDGVWLPVSVDVYEKIIELLHMTGCKCRDGKILSGDFRLGIIPQKKGNERAIIITSSDPVDIINS
jgi:hypothetical protein